MDNTQGESACQALKEDGWKGLYKVFQRKRDEVQGLYKVCTKRMYEGMLQRLYKVYNKDRVIQRSQSYRLLVKLGSLIY
jgi:hypothetical protein